MGNKDVKNSLSNDDKKSPKKIKKGGIVDKQKNALLVKKGKVINKVDNLKSKIGKKKHLLKKKNNSSKSDKESKKGSKKNTDDHIFKVPSLESFRLQKNKSTKLLSPPSPKAEDQNEKINNQIGS